MCYANMFLIALIVLHFLFSSIESIDAFFVCTPHRTVVLVQMAQDIHMLNHCVYVIILAFHGAPTEELQKFLKCFG